ncbi:Flp family type IVb pilin [Burkholderia cepacia]|uniref:Flp family type IVb pilin n=1 Tax=Burkholderia cepacia TaxID=292 RepID=A0A2S8IUR6_BURCE|nr:Flp family type IVb pilin [Burkholderia cepacia]PQP18524.1 Flp family type IVb pilin [Burkholderia cepacia]HDR9507474.1 Flp family type IVb pilin [Burkholderia cepacia]
MIRIIEKIAWFTQDQRGVTAIEYGLIAALIAIGIVAALATVGTDLQTLFNTVADDLESVVAGI